MRVHDSPLSAHQVMSFGLLLSRVIQYFVSHYHWKQAISSAVTIRGQMPPTKKIFQPLTSHSSLNMLMQDALISASSEVAGGGGVSAQRNSVTCQAWLHRSSGGTLRGRWGQDGVAETHTHTHTDIDQGLSVFRKHSIDAWVWERTKANVTWWVTSSVLSG